MLNISSPPVGPISVSATGTPPWYPLLNMLLNSKGFPIIILAFLLIILALIFKKDISVILRNIKALTFIGKNNRFDAHISPPELKSVETKSLETSVSDNLDLIDKPSDIYPSSVEDWRIKMFLDFFDKNFKGAEEAYKKIQNLETDPKQLKIDQLRYLESRYCYMGDGEALNKLIALKTDAEIKGYVHQSIGWCHEHGENFLEAINEFIEASKAFDKKEDKINAKIYAAKNILKTNGIDLAVELLTEELKSIPNTKLQVQIYKGLAELYDLKKDNEMKTIILEKVLKINPNDNSLLFNTGYSASELSKNFYSLSLLHYKNALKFGSSGETLLNNLGAQYERLGLPIKSAEYYKQSIERGSTLAAANLSYKYLDSGFEKEAKDVIDKVINKDNVHKNVYEASKALLEEKEREDKKERECLEEATQQQNFLAEFTDKFFIPTGTKNYSGSWLTEDGTIVVIEQTNDLKITGYWTSDMKRKFTGQLKNLGAKITNYRMLYSRTLVNLGKEIDYVEDGEGFLFIENNTVDNIKIMNIKDDGRVSFLSIKRMA